MPIMSATAQNDVRGTAWLLASATKQCLLDPATGNERFGTLNNVYRLLEAFRTNRLFALGRSGSDYPTRSADLYLASSSNDVHVIDIKEAMQTALATSFGATAKDEAIERLEGVLRSVLDPSQYQSSAEDRQKADLFFTEMMNLLAHR